MGFIRNEIVDLITSGIKCAFPFSVYAVLDGDENRELLGYASDGKSAKMLYDMEDLGDEYKIAVERNESYDRFAKAKLRNAMGCFRCELNYKP